MFRALILMFVLAATSVAAPVVSTVLPAPASSPASLTQVSVTFNEAVSGVQADHLLINGESAAAVSGAGAGPYTFSFTEPLPGTVSVSFDVNAEITNLIGEVFAIGEGWQYTLADSVAPVIVSTSPAASSAVSTLTTAEVVFSEEVSGVDAADLWVNGIAAQGVTGSGAGPYIFSFAQPATGAVVFTWAGAHGIKDTSPAQNAFGGTGWNASRVGSNGTLVINEFLAANGTGVLDEDGDKEDWIEILNTGASTVNLAGWSLTENDGNLRKWTFPARTLSPGAHLLVFASGKDRRPVSGNLHTNFKLNENGGYLALVGPDYPPAPVAVFEEYPAQRYDYSYGRAGANLVYLKPPTPGASNGTSDTFSAVTAAPAFSVSRRLFETSFPLAITSATPGATIRYTTNGSQPTETNGFTYSGPLNVMQTTVIRAAAFSANAVPSVTVTQSYISMPGLLSQGNNPPGYPETWGSRNGVIFSPARNDSLVPADYEMDPEVVNDPTVRNGKTNAQRIRESFDQLPVMSIVMDIDDMFGPNGLHPRSTQKGDTYEKPASVEMVLPGGETAFATTCGIRMHGNASRDPSNNPKHGFKLKFRGDYGASKLQYQLFPDSPVEEFDDIILRADFNSSWRHWDPYQRERGTRIRDAWSKDTAREMGVVAGHNRFVHLFINGIYWGTYDPTEQLTDDFAEAYLGGDKNDYDVYDQGARKAGTSTAYNAMTSISAPIDTAKYEEMKQYLNVQEFIDYMLLHFFIGHQDWATDINKNWYAMNNRVAGGGFRYIPWDQENILWEPNMNRVNVSTPPSGLHSKLKGNTQYQLDFADRVHRHLVAPDGALQPGKNIERWKARLREIDSATVAESARWGDYRRDVHRRSSPYVLFSWHEHFANENARMLGSYFPVRSENVLAQLRSADLYPDVAAPLYRRGGTGGEVLGSSHLAPGTQIAMTRSGTGTILYTTDGTDPRVYYAGTTSASAQTYSTPVTVHSSVTIKSRVLSGGEWSALNEAVFTVGTMASPVRITEIMYAPPGGGEYEFLELQNVTTQPVDVSGWYLGGIDFLLPLGTVLAPGRRIILASNDDPAAWAARYPGVSVFGYFGGSLNNSGERISLRNRGGRTMTSVNYGVTAPWPVQANGGGYSLEIIDSMGDPDSPWNWQAVTIRGTAGLGNTAPAAAAVVISEVLAKNGGAVTNGGTNPDYVELHNPGAAEVDLAGWQLVTKNTMTIPAGTTIPAGGYLVIWCDSEFAAPGLHTGGASLAMEEGDVALFPPGANTPADAVRYGAQVEDLAIGRIAGAWKLIAPSPGAANVAVQLAPPASLRLNEWLASTGAGTDDFVELFNTHATLPVALEGVQIQTSTELHRIEALAFAGPRGFVAFKADESPGADHLNFKLPASGSTLTLRDPDSTVIETITFGEQALMIAEGRILDGENTITGGLTPSPGAANILPPAPTIAEHPTDKSASVGGSASFAVTANGSAPLTYQWRLGGIDLPGKTQPTLALSGITAAEAGVYTCLVKNTAGQAESNPARLTVTETFEAWRSAHFTAGELEDPLISGLAADPDGDGLSNLQEFFHGLDPRAGNGGSLDGILPEITIEDGPPRLVTLSFRRSKTVAASAAELEASLLLDDEDWTIVPSGEITEETAVEPISGDSLIRWKLPLAPGEPRKFLRLRITP